MTLFGETLEAPVDPGPREARLHFFDDGELVHEEDVVVDVTRADGFFEGTDEDGGRVSLTLSHHDATTDLDATIVDLGYCGRSAVCR